MKSFIKCSLLFLVLTASLVNAQWHFQTSGTDNKLHSIYFVDQNTGWAIGDTGVILNTTDGGENWLPQASGTTGDLWSVYFIDANTGWIAGDAGVDANGIILKTTNGGTDWVPQTVNTITGLYSIQFINQDLGWAVGDFAILKTINGGTEWTSQEYWFQSSVFFVDENFGWVVDGAEGGIMKTTNGGSSWTNQGTVPYEGLLSVHFADQNTGWTVGYNGTIWNTTNGGTNWNLQSSGTNSSLTSVFFINQNRGWVVGDSGIVLKTDNSGANWMSFESGTNKRLWSVHFIDRYKGWAAGDSGIVLTTGNGGVPVELTSFNAFYGNNVVNLSWTTATELNNLGFEIERSKNKIDWRIVGFKQGKGTTTETHNYSFIDEDIGEYSSKLYYRLKQTDYDGSFEYSDIVEVEIVTTQSEFSLEQNYPNPFNGTTTIGYILPEKAFVDFRLIDCLGNTVKVFAHEEQEPGAHFVKVNSDNFASGIYFYRIVAGNLTATKRMILLK